MNTAFSPNLSATNLTTSTKFDHMTTFLFFETNSSALSIALSIFAPYPSFSILSAKLLSISLTKSRHDAGYEKNFKSLKTAF